jgi:hypothetical protein
MFSNTNHIFIFENIMSLNFIKNNEKTAYTNTPL